MLFDCIRASAEERGFKLCSEGHFTLSKKSSVRDFSEPKGPLWILPRFLVDFLGKEKDFDQRFKIFSE